MRSSLNASLIEEHEKDLPETIRMNVNCTLIKAIDFLLMYQKTRKDNTSMYFQVYYSNNSEI